MLGQANKIPELVAANEELFEYLRKVRTRGAMELAAELYKKKLANLRDRGIITKQRYGRLSSAIPMRVDYAWAKATGEVGTPAEVKAGTAKMTPARWLKEKGYLDRSFMEMLAQDFPLVAAAAYYPQALVEVAEKRIKQLAKLPKIAAEPKRWPWWAWALIGTAGLGAGVYVLRSVTAAVREAREFVE